MRKLFSAIGKLFFALPLQRDIFLTPIQKFVYAGSKGGTLLFATTLLALVWANTPWASYYHELLHMELGITFENFSLKKPLILWVNDGLMSLFFFMIGLELKRELIIGELNSPSKLALPLITALGGVMVPIGIYLYLNENPETARGWGITMATDIAFALAILNLLGDKVPLNLKVFLTAFAIADDIAAVIVIALFYSSDIQLDMLLAGLGVIIFLGLLFKYVGYNYETAFAGGIVAWFFFLKSGIHPTIAGVLLAFTIPIKRKINFKNFSVYLERIYDKVLRQAGTCSEHHTDRHILDKEQIETIYSLENLTGQVVSPLQHLENKLHRFSAYFILPVFAFANAGVTLDLSQAFDTELLLNIAVGLSIGKFTGVLLFSYLAVRIGLARLPQGVANKHLVGIAALSGVGFTMSMFINHLAFGDMPRYVDSAKAGIMLGSFISGLTGYLILYFRTSRRDEKVYEP